MRELRFRVFDKVDYVSDFTLKDLQEGKIQFTDDCHVMQFTGLKDKNGVDIYEGDIILAHENQANYPLNYIVVFNDEETAFRLRWEGHCKEKNPGFYDKKISPNQYKRFEVIGNIYQSPELLTP